MQLLCTVGRYTCSLTCSVGAAASVEHLGKPMHCLCLLAVFSLLMSLALCGEGGSVGICVCAGVWCVRVCVCAGLSMVQYACVCVLACKCTVR